MESRSQNPNKQSIDGVTRKKRVAENNFFVELDAKKNRFGIFWLIVVIFLLIIFTSLIIFALNFRREKIHIGNSFSDTTESIDTSSFSQRASLISSYGLAKLVFNGQEFVSASGSNSEDFPLKDSQFIFSQDQIMLSGKIRDSWWPMTVKIKITALAVDGKFKFIIAPDEIGNMVVFGHNKDKIEQTFDQNINKVLEEKNIIAKDLTVSNDRLELQVIRETRK